MKKRMLLSLILIVFMFSACKNNSESTSQNEQNDLSVEETEAYIKKGKGIASATFATLSAQLGKALKEGGVSEAVEVCNIAAFPLVDSLSKVHNASIRRTSLKIRNPKNAPSTEEIKVLEKYAQDFESGITLAPKVVQVNGMVSFYAPITIQPLCLNCHGKRGDTMKDIDYAMIKKLYPLDKAIDYVQDDLRGVWSIQFKK